MSCFVISPSVALTATAPSSEGASETFCVLYDILFRQTESALRGALSFYLIHHCDGLILQLFDQLDKSAVFILPNVNDPVKAHLNIQSQCRIII